jgi:hypothetical protein
VFVDLGPGDHALLELRVPSSLELHSDQPVPRIDFVVLRLCVSCLVLELLESALQYRDTSDLSLLRSSIASKLASTPIRDTT